PSGALAQIVYSLTELEPGVRVQFLVDGEPVEVPRGDGVLTRRPVDRDDYVELAPPPTSEPS
ncbi:MAG TPA: GerMN domain-containing protein, partial [Acidimicrobiia bacterium]